MNNIFLDIEEKLSHSFLEKEKKELLKDAIVGDIFDYFQILTMFPLVSVFISYPFASMLNIVLKLNNFNVLMFFTSIIMFVILYLFNKENIINRKEIIKKNQVIEFNKMLINKNSKVTNYNIHNKLKGSDLIKILYATKVDNEILIQVNKEINQKINKKDLINILKDPVLIEIININKQISYGYLFKLLEKIKEYMVLNKEKTEIQESCEFKENLCFQIKALLDNKI